MFLLHAMETSLSNNYPILFQFSDELVAKMSLPFDRTVIRSLFLYILPQVITIACYHLILSVTLGAM